MKKIIPLILAISGVAYAQQQDTQTVNKDLFLKQLQAIKNQQQSTVKMERGKVIETFNAAASNGTALDLYEQAVQVIQFDGESREITQFHDWKKKETDRLKSKGFQEALRLHLIYLALTIQNAGGTKAKDLLPALISYTGEVEADGDLLVDGTDFLQKPLDQSIFVKRYGIEGMLSGGDEGWVMTPGNVDGIYQKTILPIWREKKDPSAVDYWNGKLQREFDNASNSKRTFVSERFAQITKPDLLWNRAMEYYQIGQEKRGLTDMLEIIKTYPTHPEAAQWTAQIELLLSAK